MILAVSADYDNPVMSRIPYHFLGYAMKSCPGKGQLFMQVKRKIMQHHRTSTRYVAANPT